MTPCSVLPVTAALHGTGVATQLLDALHDVLQPLDAHVVSTVAEADPELPLVVLLVTGGTEQLVLDAHAERERVVPGEPMLLLTHPDQNSLPAALEALARLQRDGARGRIVMAHADRPDEAERRPLPHADHGGVAPERGVPGPVDPARGPGGAEP